MSIKYSINITSSVITIKQFQTNANYSQCFIIIFHCFNIQYINPKTAGQSKKGKEKETRETNL